MSLILATEPWTRIVKYRTHRDADASFRCNFLHRVAASIALTKQRARERFMHFFARRLFTTALVIKINQFIARRRGKNRLFSPLPLFIAMSFYDLNPRHFRVISEEEKIFMTHIPRNSIFASPPSSY